MIIKIFLPKKTKSNLNVKIHRQAKFRKPLDFIFVLYYYYYLAITEVSIKVPFSKHNKSIVLRNSKIS